MVLHQTPGVTRRRAVLIVSYAALVAVAVVNWAAWHVHMGVIAAIPLLFIAYYARLSVALITAACAGIILAILDRDEVHRVADVLTIPAISEALMMSVALCAVVLVSERLQRAHMEAQRDSLTGVPNRAYFLDRLRACIRSMRRHEHIGVLFADLDGFKSVNDTAGHVIGDRVLVLAAERLRHAIRANDVLARIGGDEFAILIKHLPEQSEADALAQKIQAQFVNPFSVGEVEFKLGVTLGVSIAPQDGRDPDALLRTADARMYRRKQAKRTAHVTTGEA